MIARLARVAVLLSAAVLVWVFVATAQPDPSVGKKGGKVTITQRNALSADGKSRTVTTTGTDAQGQKVSNVAVFEKQ